MRLIDADDLPSDVMLHVGEDDDEFEFVYMYDIEHAPTIDAVPVVRCKDCKHNQLPPTSANAMCDLWYGMTDLFGYCSSGERREDETD